MFKRLRFAEFVIISFALHSLTVAVMSVSKSKPKIKEITIEILDQPPVPIPQAIRLEKAKKVEQLEKQIVEQEEKKTNEEAPDTRFLSAQNQKVKKETVAQNKGEFKNSKKDVVEKKSWNLAPKLNSTTAFSEDAEKKEDPTDKKDEVAEASQSEDYLKNVDKGLETLLNAREFKYYTYYNRIRRQLSQHWESNVRSKLTLLFKQGRYIASDTDKITKVIVVLDRSGNLVKIQVLKESGVSDLDEAATRAFQSAAPFPNPPHGIIENDGTVKIRWDFVLES